MASQAAPATTTNSGPSGWTALAWLPSHNGQPGGKRVGQQMTHYIDAGGGFEKACERLLGKGFQISWVDRAEDEPERKPRTTRTKYTCKGCGLNVWAKPDASIRCGDCDRPLHVGGLAGHAIAPAIKAGGSPLSQFLRLP